MATDTEILNKNVVDRLISEDMLLYNNNTSQKEEKLEGQELSEDYNCDCGEVFQTISALKRHESYDCTLTNETVSMTPRDPDSPITSERQESKSMSDVEGPMDINEQEEHGEYRCDECPKSFQWKSNLIRHQMSHDAGKKFSCENCDKFFTDPSNLQRHIRSQHVGARSHACSECGKTFATSSGLKQHQHIHSSVKPFQCEVCLKAYTQFSNLCRHKRMHADCRQQIKCKDCGQAFSTVTSLSKHKRFCEGALRNGMHLGFPTPDKISPLGLPHVSAMNGQSQINPALYMGMYRPPFPLYPPMTSFPLFPGTHPFSGLSPMSPLSPGKLSSACGNKPLLSPYSLSAIGKIERENKTDDHKRRRNSVGSESNDSPGSSGTEHDNNSSASDAESDCSSSKKSRFDPDESRDIRYVPFQPHRPIPYMPLPQNNKISASSSPVSPVNRTTDSLSSPNNRLTESSMPYDFSKTNKTRISSPVRERSPEIQTKSSGEQPLDLTRKTQKEEIVAPENSRKTHIFGLPCPISETKLHYAYPQPPKPMMLDHLHMEKAKLQQSLQEVTKFLPFSRFPLGNTSYAAAALGMLKADDKAFSPLMKIDNLQEHFQFGSPHKMKERYSCKFCGKVFPRSANLTRHLRTHTGEQPYKCKYCERSFSISSNLQRHVRNIHNKEKPFRCSLCDRCFGQQTNLDRHLKKHETEGPNVRDSPVTEPDLDSKDEAYFSEIRNFIGKATDIDITSENPSDIISNGLHHMIDRNADRDEKFDDAIDDVEEESDEENDVDDEDEHLDSKDNRVVSNHQNHDKPLNNNDIKPSVMIKEDSDKIALNKLVRPEVILENAFRKYLPCM